MSTQIFMIANKYIQREITITDGVPNNYDMDFVFASVMVSNPFMWCELQNL